MLKIIYKGQKKNIYSFIKKQMYCKDDLALSAADKMKRWNQDHRKQVETLKLQNVTEQQEFHISWNRKGFLYQSRY